MKKITKLLAVFALVGYWGQAQAGIMFSFTESGGNVLMASSGTIDTDNLTVATNDAWSGTGIFNHPSTDLMGGTDVGTTDTGFAFNSGTDFSAWQIGNPWNTSFFSFTFTGTKGFSTYISNPAGGFLPGLQVLNSQLVGSLWTPDQNWTATGQTFASIGMNVGTYTVADALTGESITFQIGQAVNVPTPATLALFGLGLAGLGWSRRKKA